MKLSNLSLAALIGFACSGSSGTSLADYQTDYITAQCNWLVRCGQYPDLNTCQQYAAEELSVTPSYVAVVNAGKATFDAGMAQKCIDFFDGLSCNESYLLDANEALSCDNPVDGKSGSGVTCETDYECQSQYCAPGSDTDCGYYTCCTGTCMPVAPLGSAGDDCSATSCQAGTLCGYQGSDRVCVALSSAGAPCTDSESCAPPYGCDLDETTDTGTCEVLPALGSACPDGACADYGVSCTNGTCTAAAFVGQSCATAECAYYATCDATTEMCVAKPGPGQPCDVDNTCAPGAYCPDTTGGSAAICAALQGNGGACDDQYDCKSSFCASDDTCADAPVCL